jgi:CBS domain-containing protein
MSCPAATIRADAPLAEAARMMWRCGVKRLPEVDDEGHAVGIVSRGDLLAVSTRRDEGIRDEIVDDVIPTRCSWTPRRTRSPWTRAS